MGTSKSLPTPSGGAWTPLKNDISEYLEGNKNVSPAQILGGTVRALRSLNVASPGRSSASKGSRTGSGSAGGGGGRSAISRAASGLAGFASAFQSGGLDEALEALGLDELRGRPAAEVVAKIADHLAEGTDATEYELLSDALKAALMEAAALENDVAYHDLEAALQAYFETHGIEALVQSYLSQYVYDRVWMAVENHVDMKSQDASTAQAMSIAVGNACRSHVESLIHENETTGRFNGVDWFGRTGMRLCNELVAELEGRLKTL